MAGTQRELTLATFAAGCFWDVQAAYAKIPGVAETTAGYIGGSAQNPTQEQVARGGTGHVEAVQLKYDASQVSYERLLAEFWEIAPTMSVHALESSTGQYSPIIFTHSDEQYSAARESLLRIKTEGKYRITATHANVFKAGGFWPEPDERHQHYLRKLDQYFRHKFGSAPTPGDM